MHQNNPVAFPDVDLATPEGILAIGGDLSTKQLILAYKSGIFPWFNPGEPIVWWAPPQRMVLFPETYKPSKSLQKTINSGIFSVTFNENFESVITNCQTIKRDGQDGTWISNEMLNAYCELHEQGYAKSVEVWFQNKLVGGLYGIDLGKVFCGESMFSKKTDASKVALAWLVSYLKNNHYLLLDGQVHNSHLESLGFTEINRASFMQILKM